MTTHKHPVDGQASLVGWRATPRCRDAPGGRPAPTKELPRVKTILLVEDDDDIGEFLVATLVQKTSYRVLRASTSFAALHVLTYLEPDLLILEYHLPDMDGIQLSDQLHLLHGREAIPTILLGTALPIVEIKKRKIVGVHNPFDLRNFLLTIERGLTQSSPRRHSISGG